MKIGILGWGSLIKEPGELLSSGDWQKDGPVLWIEFSRISQSGIRAGCLTLVIDEDTGAEICTYYTISQCTVLLQAITDLQKREGTSSKNIGFFEVASGNFAGKAQKRQPKSCERIRAWASGKGFDAIVWTALPPQFHDILGIPFTPAAALNYLNSLPATIKDNALGYIHAAPEQTMTPFRRLLLESHA